MLDTNGDKSLYIQLINIIKEQIRNGELKAGDKLISENAYSKQFQVNRNTVRQALQKLKEEGVIYSQQGKGNFISNLKIAYNVSEKTRYSTEILNQGLTPSAKLLSNKIIKADKDISQQLEVEENTDVVKLEILRFADDMPLCLTISYLDASKYGSLIEYINEESFSLSEILEKRFNTKTQRTSTVFEAINPSQSDMLKLKISKNISLLVTKSRNKNEKGEVVEYGISKFRSDIAQIKIQM